MHAQGFSSQQPSVDSQVLISSTAPSAVSAIAVLVDNDYLAKPALPASLVHPSASSLQRESSQDAHCLMANFHCPCDWAKKPQCTNEIELWVYLQRLFQRDELRSRKIPSQHGWHISLRPGLAKDEGKRKHIDPSSLSPYVLPGLLMCEQEVLC